MSVRQTTMDQGTLLLRMRSARINELFRNAMDLPFSLACCNKSIIAFPLRTPGWILSGRFGKLAKAHSSSQGIPTSSAILFNGLTALSRPVEAGAKACAEAKVRARIENLIFVVYLSVCSCVAKKNRQSRWIHASAPSADAFRAVQTQSTSKGIHAPS